MRYTRETQRGTRFTIVHQKERERDGKEKECHTVVFYSFCNSVFPIRRGATEKKEIEELIENSIILFLSSRSRVVLGIDRQIHNATWVSELARASAYLPDAATTELAYWALRRPSLRSPPTKRADSSWRLARRLLDVGRTCRATLIEERVDLTSLRTPTASVRRDFCTRFPYEISVWIYVGRKIHLVAWRGT